MMAAEEAPLSLAQAPTRRLNMIEAIKCAALLQKVHTLDPRSLLATDVLQMATIEGARALAIDSGWTPVTTTRAPSARNCLRALSTSPSPEAFAGEQRA